MAAQILERTAILIVDDEAIVRFDLVDFFEDAGFQVFDAESADHAITVLETNPTIRIVLTDVQMPGSMDGVKLAHYVRDRYPPTLLVVASGVARPSVQQLPVNAMFVSKPFDPRQVLAAIRRAVPAG
ncbi:response regulator [Sphingomonas sp.]|jgi:DNA-binding NtrC family response regulator|uniref:response regulator n=1 Tax=Sphingomonas sp. TaxID=28214 RepID=UPI002ED9A95C